MIDMTRIKEMQVKFYQAGEKLIEQRTETRSLVDKGKEVGQQYSIKLHNSPNEVLVAVGIARNEEEAGEFLGSMLGGLAYARDKGELNEVDAAFAALKTGFYIGLLAGQSNPTAN
jgi:hypothetical protein